MRPTYYLHVRDSAAQHLKAQSLKSNVASGNVLGRSVKSLLLSIIFRFCVLQFKSLRDGYEFRLVCGEHYALRARKFSTAFIHLRFQHSLQDTYIYNALQPNMRLKTSSVSNLIRFRDKCVLVLF